MVANKYGWSRVTRGSKTPEPKWLCSQKLKKFQFYKNFVPVTESTTLQWVESTTSIEYILNGTPKKTTLYKRKRSKTTEPKQTRQKVRNLVPRPVYMSLNQVHVHVFYYINEPLLGVLGSWEKRDQKDREHGGEKVRNLVSRPVYMSLNQVHVHVFYYINDHQC